MKSIRNEQFSQPLAENQEEYNTLYVHVQTEGDPMRPVTACFKLAPEEIAEINRTGLLYYQQCTFYYRGSDGLIKPGLFHPMSIHVTNPLEPQEPLVPKPLVPLTEMSGDHFKQIFYAEGYAPSLVKSKIGMFKSLYGFASCIANIGRFNSYRLAFELGYDVEFTLDPS